MFKLTDKETFIILHSFFVLFISAFAKIQETNLAHLDTDVMLNAY